jgi:glycosyltransferase involved in cell wall biosynthesis
MAKTKILTIITKLELGGAQQVALTTLRALPKDHYQCYLISGQGGLLVDEAHRLEGVQVQLWRSFKHPIRPLADLITLIRLYRFIRQEGIDIVHTHSSKAGLLGRLAAQLANVKKIIHTIHGWSFHEQQSNLKKKLFICLEKIAAAKTHHLIAVSQATKAKGLACGIGRSEQYQVILPGSELAAFGPGIVDDHQWLHKEFGFTGYPPVVAMISNLKPQKAPLDFVQAAYHVHQQLGEVRFLLVGDGPLRKAVDHEIKKLGLSEVIKCAGWRQDIPDILRGSDIMVLSSLWEGLPCVFGQAMKTGLPIVATNVEGAQEAIEDGVTGFLVPIHDCRAMAEKIILI